MAGPINRTTQTLVAVGLPEYALSEMIQIIGPRFAVMAVAVHVPNVGHLMLFHIDVDPLGNVDEPVLVAAGQIKQFQSLARCGGIRHEFDRRFGVWRGGKPADPGERVEMTEPEV
jgi:hypothetical protein